MGSGSFNRVSQHSDNSNSLTDNGFNSSMHINRMFDEVPEQVNIYI